ncbi:MAG TPA: S9 family peptidase [Dehalococcoidia bacterium]|nr:S9 family peptidase [Dehalococcoidia bacterium]
MPSRKRPFTADDLYSIKTVSDPNVSPDGTLVAYVVSGPDREKDETQMSIYIAAIDGRTPPRRFTHGTKDHSPRWSPDGRYLAFVSDRGVKSQVFVAPMNGGEARRVTKQKWGIGSPAWSPDSKRLAYTARTGEYTEPKERKGAEKAAPRVIRDLRVRLDGVGFFDERRMHIFVADVESGEEQQITSGDYNDDHPAWSPNGRTIAFTSDRGRDRHQRIWRSDVWTVRAAGGRPRKLTRSRGSAAHPTFSPDGRYVAYAGHENGDDLAKNTHVMIVPARGGGVPRSLSISTDRPALGWPAFGAGRAFNWARDSRSLYFLAVDLGTIAIYQAPLKGDARKVLDGERQIESFAMTPDGKRAVFTAVWPNRPWELYTAPLRDRRRETNLSRANDHFLSQVTLGDVRRVTCKAAADGAEIESFAMYPPDYKRGKKYPLAINVHGGPHSFHPGPRAMTEFHALTARGYVVLLPNPRGSSGYGEKFSEMVIEDWGGADYKDILAACDDLVRRGVADPDRLYIGGYSYGGYMSAWAVGHTDRFKAALVGAPVGNLVSAFGTGDIPIFDVIELGGLPQDNMAWYIERSPITHLKNCNTPVLLVHHEGDLRCPIEQSEEIFQALKLMRKEVEFIRYPGGFHTYNTHTPSQTKDRIERIVAWYDEHAPKRAARKPAARRTWATAGR